MAATDPVPSLDLFVLTFNAGKERIDPAAFAYHLADAFGQRAAFFPDLVVICLQEMAPLAQSFIGSYMIEPYFQAYASAVHIAARSCLNWTGQDREDGPFDSPYTLVASRNVGMTGIMLFALDPRAVSGVTSTEVSFGAGEMANKGAVGLRMLFSKKNALGYPRHTELTFVATHLAPHEWNLERRNRNWETIVSGLLFRNPRKLYGANSAKPTPCTSTTDEQTPALLPRTVNEKTLHDITIYKPGSHLFVAGDLNYRISKTRPTDESDFPDLNPESPNYFGNFLALDQLSLELEAGRTLHGLAESAISFPPTYKLKLTAKKEAPAPQTYDRPVSDVVSWKWSLNRWPGWCDRVLYLGVPDWVANSSSSQGKPLAMRTINYDALPPVRTSDHRPVFLRLEVPVLEPEKLAPPPELCTADSKDPRINLPYPVNFDSWDNRARFKKWEVVIGWSMLFSQSKRGITVFAAFLLIGVGSWWLRASSA
ncbi:Endonuclease/exonuclease/phosphatase [Xylaria palmicola]|nr:Endonuclease/exonuclease/phosphatase [Xylaria palmicola]